MGKENKTDAMYGHMANWKMKNDIKNEDIKIAMELGFMEGWEKAIESTQPHLPLGGVSGKLNCEHSWQTETFDQFGFGLTQRCVICDIKRDV